MSVNGAAVGVSVAGVMFVWAGLKGESVPGAIRDILTGHKPDTSANQITTPAAAAAESAAGGSTSGVTNPTTEQSYAFSLFGQYGWGADQQQPLVSLWNQESGWNANAVNPSSGAYGIPQALGHGHPYNLGDYKAQIRWGLSYIAGRYGNPAGAWAHERANNWY